MRFIPAIAAVILSTSIASADGLVAAHKALCDKAGNKSHDIKLMNHWQPAFKAEAKHLGDELLKALNAKFGGFIDASKTKSFDLEIAVLNCMPHNGNAPYTIEIYKTNWDANKKTGALELTVQQGSMEFVAQLLINKDDALTPAGAQLLANHKGNRIKK
ncbi:MAG: hypothetical protein ACK5O7_06230 [Holosporales bacterium]